MQNTQTANKTTTSKKVVKIIANVIAWIFLVFAFLMMVFAFASVNNNYGVPIVGNKVVLNVVTPSMEPTINTGDLIIGTVLGDEEKQNLKEGDIVTFFVDLDGDGSKELNTHRIVSVFKYEHANGDVDISYNTKGDNNTKEDDWTIRDYDIVSIWREGDARLGGIGSVFGFLQSRTGFLVVVIIPLALFFIYEVARLVYAIVKIKNADKKVITQEDEEEIRRKAVEEYLRLHGQAPVADATGSTGESVGESTGGVSSGATEVSEGSDEQSVSGDGVSAGSADEAEEK